MAYSDPKSTLLLAKAKDNDAGRLTETRVDLRCRNFPLVFALYRYLVAWWKLLILLVI